MASSGVAWLVTSLGQGWSRLEVPTPRSSRDRVKKGRSETAVSESFQEPRVIASFNLGGMTIKGQSAKTQQVAVGRSCRQGGSPSPPPPGRPAVRPPGRPAAPPLAPPPSAPPPSAPPPSILLPANFPPPPAFAGRRAREPARTRARPGAGASSPPPRPLSRAAQRAPGHVRAHVTAPRPAPAPSPRAAVL